MNIKNMKLPSIILVIGMLVAVASCLLTGMIQEPIIKEHDFAYSITYKLDGEVKTIEGVFQCSFNGNASHDDLTVRDYIGTYTQNGIDGDSPFFMIAQKDGFELDIVAVLDADYLMDDPDKYDYENGNEDPYLVAYDADGMDVEVSDVFDAEIISWEYPVPIENSFKFIGFSSLHAISMFAMLLVGGLTIVACVIFVKKEDGVSYTALDIVSIVANIVIGLVAIPCITLSVWLMALVASTEDILYQVFLCLPAFTAFTIAVSVALRRKGFSKSGFVIPLIGPAFFFLCVIWETTIANLF